jgi:O-antigen ligase
MRDRSQPIAFRLAVLTVLIDYTVSANLLTCLGLPYELDGGNPLEKIHPGSYCAGLAMVARLVAERQPLRRCWSVITHDPELPLFFGAIGFCILYAGAMTGAGNLITLFDTYLPAGMLAVALCDLSAAERAALRRVLRFLLLVNASIALAEAVCSQHFGATDPSIPELAADFRPTALYDHPLTGAAATMIGLFMTPDLKRRPLAGACYAAILTAGLLVFGGRVALAVLIAIVMARLASVIWGAAMRRRLATSYVVALALMLIGAAAVVCVACAAGLGTRLITHLYWDPSAQARLDQFRILGSLDAGQILLGTARADLIARIEPLRLGYSVDVLENFWLLMFVCLGALCFVPFCAGLAGLAHFLWRRSGSRGRMIVLALFLAASGSNSLGRKSPLLVMLVACTLATASGQQSFAVAAHRRSVGVTA